ncbi:hypothetical protein EYF80_030893 [Liparis tanakae]|uniref:Uncharacterized protein n=1 Tax=Liparis tanakae TaxID=230148 RepID=A0A4Z2H1C2_9TELE|nr:hypothetical protein EYF80_030893 [Liparis tanakae]
MRSRWADVVVRVGSAAQEGADAGAAAADQEQSQEDVDDGVFGVTLSSRELSGRPTICLNSPAINQQKKKKDVNEFQAAQIGWSGLAVPSSGVWAQGRQESPDSTSPKTPATIR